MVPELVFVLAIHFQPDVGGYEGIFESLFRRIRLAKLRRMIDHFVQRELNLLHLHQQVPHFLDLLPQVLQLLRDARLLNLQAKVLFLFRV